MGDRSVWPGEGGTTPWRMCCSTTPDASTVNCLLISFVRNPSRFHRQHRLEDHCAWAYWRTCMIMQMIHLVQATNLASKTPDGRFGSRHKVSSFCSSGAQSVPDFTYSGDHHFSSSDPRLLASCDHVFVFEKKMGMSKLCNSVFFFSRGN